VIKSDKRESDSCGEISFLEALYLKYSARVFYFYWGLGDLEDKSIFIINKECLRFNKSITLRTKSNFDTFYSCVRSLKNYS